MDNRFNLVEENWIPVAGEGLVSLRRIFSDSGLKSLGGNPVQKIAVTKLLLAIAQSAYTPEDDEDWARIGVQGVAEKSLAYLEAKKDCFWLYGERPFLQIPAVEKAGKVSFGALQPFVTTGNTTVLTQINVETDYSDAEKALLVVQIMGFGLGGKKTDNSIVLSPGYQGKTNEKGRPSTGRPGPSLGFWGYLHTFLLGSCIKESIWLNLLTKHDLVRSRFYPGGAGIPPWDNCPLGEADNIAESMKKSLMGRLVPMSRSVLLAADGMHYSEGLLHPTYKEGGIDPSVAINFKDSKVLWVDPNKRPWRNLTSLLAFLENQTESDFICLHLKFGIERIKNLAIKLGIWSGGLRASGNTAGEQKVSGDDDFVESEVYLNTSVLSSNWFSNIKSEMSLLDNLSKSLYGAILGYYKEQKAEGEKFANQGFNLFWQLSEQHFQSLLDVCEDSDFTKSKSMRPQFGQILRSVYDGFCPQDTARQLEAWTKNRPNLGWYLRGESGPGKKPENREKKPKKEALT